jgi:hypothetical protein
MLVGINNAFRHFIGYDLHLPGAASGAVSMSKLVKIFAAMALIAGAIAVTPGSAEARHWGGGWHGGWGNWGGCCRSYSYAYYPRAYYSEPYYAVPYYVVPRRWVSVHHLRHRFWGFRHRW